MRYFDASTENSIEIQRDLSRWPYVIHKIHRPISNTSKRWNQPAIEPNSEHSLQEHCCGQTLTRTEHTLASRRLFVSRRQRRFQCVEKLNCVRVYFLFWFFLLFVASHSYSLFHLFHWYLVHFQRDIKYKSSTFGSVMFQSLNWTRPFRVVFACICVCLVVYIFLYHFPRFNQNNFEISIVIVALD